MKPDYERLLATGTDTQERYSVYSKRPRKPNAPWTGQWLHCASFETLAEAMEHANSLRKRNRELDPESQTRYTYGRLTASWSFEMPVEVPA